MFRGSSRYAHSKLRIALLAALLLAAAFVGTGWAQSAAPTPASPGAPAGVRQSTLFSVVFGQNDPISWIIAALSVTGLTLIIQGFIKNRAAVLMPEASTFTIREMIAQKRFRELIEFTETDPSFVSKALNPALKRAPSFASMKEAMETAIGEQTADRFRSIEYLNIIGNLGPLLGLTGTVLGMIVAFNEMNNAGGNASPAQLAGGISKALAHTFLGLFLAVPCIACFGILRTLVDRLTMRASLVAEELLLMVKPQETRPPIGMPPATAAAVRSGGTVAGMPSPVVRKPPVAPLPQ